MKKLIIATLFFTGLVAFVPNASAGHNDRYRDRDRDCDHREYREVYRPTYRCYEERYYRPAPVVRYRSYDDDNCRPAYRTSRRSPLSFVFGF